jgi:hypothetical protein
MIRGVSLYAAKSGLRRKLLPSDVVGVSNEVLSILAILVEFEVVVVQLVREILNGS